jgi:hypothetical protein
LTSFTYLFEGSNVSNCVLVRKAKMVKTFSTYFCYLSVRCKSGSARRLFIPLFLSSYSQPHSSQSWSSACRKATSVINGVATSPFSFLSKHRSGNLFWNVIAQNFSAFTHKHLAVKIYLKEADERFVYVWQHHH